MSQIACLAVATLHVGYSSQLQGFRSSTPEYLDRTMSPLVDFYRFSNGAWLDKVQIGVTESEISALGVVRNRNGSIVRRLISDAVDRLGQTPTASQRLVAEFFLTATDENRAEQEGLRPIQDELSRISAIETRRDIMAELGRLHRRQIWAGFSTVVQFNPLDSSQKVLCLQEPTLSLRHPSPYNVSTPKSLEALSTLRKVAVKSFVNLGQSPSEAQESAASSIEFERVLARAGTKTESDHEQDEVSAPIKLTSLGHAVKNVDWWIYFEHLGRPQPRMLRTSNMDCLKAFGRLVREAPIVQWKNYLRWLLLLDTGPLLSKSYAANSFLVQSAASGQPETQTREQIAVNQTSACLGDELGQLFAQSSYSVFRRDKVEAMVNSIRLALRETISESTWLSSVAKTKAIEKLDLLRVNIGYPDKWRDSEGLDTSHDSFAQNVLSAREFAFQQSLEQIDRPSDRNEWMARSFSSDARYNTNLNLITLPAGIFQAPYFDPDADDARNYGALGAVVGHELMHAFDDRGRKYDGKGNLNGWWCKADELRFKEYEDGLAAQYEKYLPIADAHINGRSTLAENIADLGGMKIAYRAFRKVQSAKRNVSSGEFTPDQRFFISYGQLFRCKMRPEVLRLGLETDAHAPPQFRVKGVLQNMPEFWKAFHSAPPISHLTIW